MVYHESVIGSTYDDLMPLNFGYEDCAGGHSFGPAVRSFWLLHYVCSGFGTFVREGVSYSVGPGQMFVIPPDEVTVYTADGEKPWSYHWIGFSCGELLLPLGAVHTCPEAGEVFERLRACRTFEGGRSAYVRGVLWQVFALLLEQNKQEKDYIHAAKSYMSAEYVNGINIGDVAKELGLDRSYFSSYFKERVGISPREYLLNLRMEKAAALMLAAEKPSVAAASVGYTDIFVFSKAFKRHYGVSPREYVKNNK